MKTVWRKQVLIALEVCLIAFVSSTLIYFCHLFPLDTLRENIIPKLSFVNKNKGVANRGPLTSKNSWKKIIRQKQFKKFRNDSYLFMKLFVTRPECAVDVPATNTGEERGE